MHRAFDLVPDFDDALEEAIGLGFSRILTSGGASSAEEGQTILAHLCKRANGRISIMPGGGGIGAGNAHHFVAMDGIRELHGSCSSPCDQVHPPKVSKFGFVDAHARQTDANKVRALKAAIG